MEQLPVVHRSRRQLNAIHAAAPWPYRHLDVGALRRSGWRPTAFREFVLKIHQRCNLACDYCYVYTMADQSWRTRPKTMSSRVWSATAERIGEHVATHHLDEVTVILHGGEPLLAGADRIDAVVSAVRAALPAGALCRFALQTNGVLLDEAMLRLLDRNDISVGVSLDGAGQDNDRHRMFANGLGSFDAVRTSLQLLRGPAFRRLYSGLLATVDPGIDPVKCYEALLEFEPPGIDFLLPHANWSQPHRASTLAEHPFGDWLLAVFDRWYDAPAQETGIRIFEEILQTVLGGESRSEAVGLSSVAVAVVETDGAIEQADSLKSAYHGAASTGRSVLTDSFDATLDDPGIIARQIGVEALSDTCRECELHLICGGGMYPHRYRAGHGFRNPSVYCADLGCLIDHVGRRVAADLAVRGHALLP